MVLAKNRFVAYALRLGFNDLYQYLWLRKGGPGAIPNPAANQRYKNTTGITLESGINIQVRLLIFEFFPGATSLLKGATFIDFWFLKNFLRLFNFLFLWLCIQYSNYLLFKKGYVYSRGYVYYFCQMFQGLRLFKGVRLFWTLEYAREKYIASWKARTCKGLLWAEGWKLCSLFLLSRGNKVTFERCSQKKQLELGCWAS